MTWNDTVIEDGANGTELPKFDDANSTPVKMRMKKSNGNIVDVDILSTFLLEKLDATTLNTLMSATSPVTLGINDGKVVIGVDGSAVAAKAITFNDTCAYTDIMLALYNQESVYYFRSNETGTYLYVPCGFSNSADILFACGNRVLAIATDGTRTETISQYAKVFTYGNEYESSDFENCFAICDYNGQYLYQNGTNGAFTGINDGNIVSTSWSESGWDSITTTPLSKENILIIGVNTTTYSIADLAKYDVVILNAGGVKHLLTELTSKKAVFSGTYLVGDMVVSRTYTYDGTNWTVNDAGSLYRVKVNANTEPQYLFNAIVEGNGISIIGGDSNTMTIASKTMVLTWRQAYPIDDLLKQEVLVCDVEGERYQCVSKTDTKLIFARADSECIKTTTYDGEVWSDIVTTKTESGKVSAVEGATPDYLGNVLKAGQNITVTKDGEQVRIDSTASGGGLEVIEVSSSTVTAVEAKWHKLTYSGDVTVELSTDITNYGFQYNATSLSKVTISTDLTHWHISGCSDRGNCTIPVYVPSGKSLVCRVWQDYVFIAVLAGTDTNSNDSNSLQSTLSILDTNIARVGSKLTDNSSTVLNLMSSLIDTVGSRVNSNLTVSTNINNSSIEVVE